MITPAEDEETGVVKSFVDAESDVDVADDHNPHIKENARDDTSNTSIASNETLTYSNSNNVDIGDLRDKCFFLFPDRKRRLTKFWLLMILSVLIATSGVAGDSAATVIGAMIVAPLMTPIQGTMLAIVLNNRKNFGFSLLNLIAGAGAAIFIAYIYGLGVNEDIILSQNNSQIANRFNPRLTDLISALATGVVASVALVRKDIADALPGVAISISLVPPLCVVGLTLSTSNGHEAAGAFLLFATNVAAILVCGVITMYIYRVHLLTDEKRRKPTNLRTAILVLTMLLAAVAVPLGFTSSRIRETNSIERCLEAAAGEWAAKHEGWKVSFVVATGDRREYYAKVYVSGPPPIPSTPMDRKWTGEVTYNCTVDVVEVVFLPQASIEL